MKFKIHRGTKEIGGSCVEIWTANSRIFLDMGMTLVDEKREQFNFEKYKILEVNELVKQIILPDTKGIYDSKDRLIDGV